MQNLLKIPLNRFKREFTVHTFKVWEGSKILPYVQADKWFPDAATSYETLGSETKGHIITQHNGHSQIYQHVFWFPEPQFP